MGLVKCPDCNREVSEIAHVCIHCGRPKPGEQPKKVEPAPPPPKKKPKPDVVLTLAGGALLCGGLASLVAGYPGYAGLALLTGLIGITAGSVLSWVKRD